MGDLTINHSFVSAKLDGSDNSLVKPSNWNAVIPYVGELPTGFGGTGVSTFLVDESNTVLTDEAGVPLDSVSAIDASLLVNARPQELLITSVPITSNVTLPGDNNTVITVDATSGVITVNLPLAASVTGRVFYIKKIDASGNNVIIAGSGSETIDDQTTAIISTRYTTLVIISDGTEWWII